MDVEQIKSQVKLIKTIGETAGVQLTTLATRSWAKTAGQGFLRSIDVAGSGCHQGVLAVGKFVGFKFKPWQAVGIAKNIGNAAKFLGPVLAIASVAADAYEMQQQQEREKQMSNARRDITSQFQTIAKELENQVQIQLWEFEAQVYGEIEKQIAAARQKEEEAIATSNKEVRQLAETRNDFVGIINYVTQVFEVPVT